MTTTPTGRVGAKRERSPTPVGVAMPDATTSTPPDIIYGWSQALSLRRTHYVPVGAPTRDHHGRPIGDAVCGWPGLIDQAGHDAALSGLCTPCHQCMRRLAGECLDCLGTGLRATCDQVEPGVVAYGTVPCEPCGGTGKLPPVPGYMPLT